jgi:hypothetical protein
LLQIFGGLNAEIGALHAGIAEQFRAGPGLGRMALFQHTGAVAQFERREGILLDTIITVAPRISRMMSNVRATRFGAKLCSC